MTAGALEIADVSRVFPGAAGATAVTALQPTTLSIAPNDFITILDPRLRQVHAAAHRRRPRYAVDGRGEAQRRQGHATRRGPRHGVPELHALPLVTVAENIAFGLREKGMPEAEQKEIVASYIAKVGLRGFENHWPKQLSGGMQQRTAIAAPARSPMTRPSSARRALRRARQPDARADAGAAPRHLGARAQDRALRHARHRGGDLLANRCLVMTARPGASSSTCPSTCRIRGTTG